jgi:hypothetical protein
MKKVLFVFAAITPLLSPWQTMAEDARTPLEPFSATCRFEGPHHGSPGHCGLSKSVPQGKRLVVETVTGTYSGQAEIAPAVLFSPGTDLELFFPWVETPSSSFSGGSRNFAFNHYVQAYVDGPSGLLFSTAGISFSGGFFSGTYYLSGYLVNLP